MTTYLVDPSGLKQCQKSCSGMVKYGNARGLGVD